MEKSRKSHYQTPMAIQLMLSVDKKRQKLSKVVKSGLGKIKSDLVFLDFWHSETLRIGVNW